MQFSDTTNQTGLIQECEFWTNLGIAGISGDTNLLAQFTSRLNRAYERILPVIFTHDQNLRWDDTNHTTHPIGVTNLVSGQGDYTYTADTTGNSVLNITKILVYDTATDTTYRELKRALPESPIYEYALSPDPTDVGVPTHYVERGSSFFLWPQPNYAATNGIKVFFERSPDYFTTADTTQTPGIPEPFHGLLPLYASHDWITVHKPDNTALITRLEAQISKMEKDLHDFILKRFPRKQHLKAKVTDYS